VTCISRKSADNSAMAANELNRDNHEFQPRWTRLLDPHVHDA
jgi:hypothetical protein